MLKRIIATCLCAAFIFSAALLGISFTGTVSAATADDLAAQINSISGLTATAAGSTVSVSGSASGAANIALNIDTGVTVNWNATLKGSATANNYLLTLSGGGTFAMQSGLISNTTGAGGTIYINSGITLNVTGGSIESPGSGSAVTVAAGTMNAVINVSGSGVILSAPNGYAINDGAGMTASDNNTKINISGGRVEAGSACAVRSTGKSTVVNISGGIVRNNAASNTNSAIYMTYAPPPVPGIENIIISGGLVETTNAGNQSYVVQTSQNVRVSGGELKSLAGRTINLVGLNSIATITGGRVSTQTGTAVSTATTTLDDVNNAKIIISGGVVEATGSGSDYSGTAVRITGTNSTASISGNAIVTAKAGLAIDASGRPSNGSVTVSGGLVFAWGNAVNKAVSPEAKLSKPVSGVVAAWNTANGHGEYPYYQNTSNDLSMEPAGSVKWDNGTGSYAGSDGITYSGSRFFPLDVTVIQRVFTVTLLNSPRAGESTTFTAEAGETVSISTSETPVTKGLNPNMNPINGNRFDGWTSGDVSISDSGSAGGASFTMPSNDVVAVASFEPLYLLIMQGSRMSDSQPAGFDSDSGRYGGSSVYGYFAAGERINIEATSATWGDESKWMCTNGGFDDDSSYFTTFIMPDGPAIVYPVGFNIDSVNKPVKHTTSVSGGVILSTTGGGALPAGTTSHSNYTGTGIIIQANDPDAGYEFDGWVIEGSYNGGSYFSKSSGSTLFIMPGYDITVTATYKEISYRLTVNGGTGSGTYKAGASVSVSASGAPGMRFAGWTIDIGGGDFDAIDSPSATFKMPDCDAVISAHYEYEDTSADPTPAPGAPSTPAPGAPSTPAPGAPSAPAPGAPSAPAPGAPATPAPGTPATPAPGAPSTPAPGAPSAPGTDTPAGPVPPGGTPDQYHKLTINDGSGEPIYLFLKNDDVTGVTAAPGQPLNPELDPSYNPVNGTLFSRWELTSGGGSFNDAEIPNTTYIMPDNDAEITAVFSPYYLLRVIGGVIDEQDRNFNGEERYGYYAAGQAVRVHAIDEDGQEFEYWEESIPGGSFIDASQKSTSYIMPAKSAMIYAVERRPGGWTRPDPVVYTVEIIDGSGIITSIAPGAARFISASALPAAVFTGDAGIPLCIDATQAAGTARFVYWEIVEGRGLFDDPYSIQTVFTAHENAKIRAVFDTRGHYKLTVVNLHDTQVSEHEAGEAIIIAAEAPDAGMVFDHWELDGESGTHVSFLNALSTFNMPPEDVVATAVYSGGSAQDTQDAQDSVPEEPAPKTGVMTYVIPAACVMVLSLAGMVAVTRKLKKWKIKN